RLYQRTNLLPTRRRSRLHRPQMDFFNSLLSHAISSAGGILFTASAGEIRWTSSPGTAEFMRAFVDGGWDKRNSRATCLAPMKYPGFVHDLDIFTREEVDRDPFYTELCRPKGVGWAAGTIIDVPNGDMMVYSFDRAVEAGPYDRSAINFLDSLRPHLARAGIMAARLHLERAKSAFCLSHRSGLTRKKR
ncbi:hypothetical protein NKI20_29755, partial [Mesorhizobium sp. M0830]